MNKPITSEVAENRFLFHDPHEIVHFKWRADEFQKILCGSFFHKKEEEITVRSVFAGDVPLVCRGAHTQHVVGVQKLLKLFPEGPFQFLVHLE